MKDLKAYTELKGGWTKLHPYITIDDISWDGSERAENGDLTLYYFDDHQKEMIARIICNKIGQFVEKNLPQILEEAKDYVGRGNIVRK
jgi:hypothetical protein